MTSSYKKTWSAAAQVCADTEFIWKQTLVTVLRDLQRINFAIVEQRQQAITIWSGMRREFIVAVDKQFPEYKFMINPEEGEFPKLVAQMQQALNHKEFSEHRDQPKPIDSKPVGKIYTIKDVEGHAAGTVMTSNPFNDAMVAFHQAVAGLELHIRDPASGFTRETFENTFGLKWEP